MRARILVVSAAAIALLVAVACVPISPDPGGDGSAMGSTIPDTTTPGSTIPEAMPTLDFDRAVATVATPSLRVRSLPSGTAPLLGALKSGEQYQVLSRSSDGGWLELAIPQIARGTGWVSASLVSVNGDITDTPISAVPAAAPAVPAATAAPEPAAVSTVAPTVAPTEEPTALPAEEPTEEPTVAPTAVPTEEPTAVPTEAPTEAPTEVPTDVPTEEPTVEPTQEPTATAEPFVLPTATPQPAEAPAEATAVPVEEPAGDEGSETAPVYTAPAAGFATVIAEPRLRVRSAPSTDGEIVGFGYPGEVFQVLGTSEDGLWTQIAGSAESAENPNGGWVATEFLLLGQ